MDCGICFDEKKLYYLNHISDNKCFVKICKDCSNEVIDKNKCPFCRVELKNVIIKSRLSYFLYYFKTVIFIILQVSLLYVSLKNRLPIGHEHHNFFMYQLILIKFIFELGYLAVYGLHKNTLNVVSKFDTMYMFHTSLFINSWEYIFSCYVFNILLVSVLFLLSVLMKCLMSVIYYPYRFVSIYGINRYTGRMYIIS